MNEINKSFGFGPQQQNNSGPNDSFFTTGSGLGSPSTDAPGGDQNRPGGKRHARNQTMVPLNKKTFERFFEIK